MSIEASERNPAEQEPKIEIRTDPDEVMLKTASYLISKYSWGKDYPIQPLDEIRKTEFCAGAYAADKLVGFAGVSRYASPDGRDNGELWFGYAVVTPQFRQQGIYQELYDTCMVYMKSAPGRLLSCTNNPIIEKFLISRSWQVIRKTRDESGAACLVFEYERNRPGAGT